MESQAITRGATRALGIISRTATIILLIVAALVGGCLVANRYSVRIVNTSGQVLNNVIVSANDRQLFKGRLEPNAAEVVRFTALLDAEYAVDVVYENGETFHQRIGSIDPLMGSDDTLKVGLFELTYNDSVTKRGTVQRRAYR